MKNNDPYRFPNRRCSEPSILLSHHQHLVDNDHLAPFETTSWCLEKRLKGKFKGDISHLFPKRHNLNFLHNKLIKFLYHFYFRLFSYLLPNFIYIFSKLTTNN